MIAFSLLILLIWFKAGCRMLNKTHPTAGTKGSSRARPLLSSWGESAICFAAMAHGEDAKVVIIAPVATHTVFGKERDDFCVWSECWQFTRNEWDRLQARIVTFFGMQTDTDMDDVIEAIAIRKSAARDERIGYEIGSPRTILWMKLFRV